MEICSAVRTVFQLVTWHSINLHPVSWYSHDVYMPSFRYGLIFQYVWRRRLWRHWRLTDYFVPFGIMRKRKDADEDGIKAFIWPSNKLVLVLIVLLCVSNIAEVLLQVGNYATTWFDPEQWDLLSKLAGSGDAGSKIGDHDRYSGGRKAERLHDDF